MTVDKQDFVVDVKKENASAPKLRKCTGPWHYLKGKGTMLPESEFDIVSRGPNKNNLSATCRSCREKHQASAQRKRTMETPNGVVESNVVVESLPKWRVTIIKSTEVIVSARDYLDAGVLAGSGEVVKVERIV